MLKDVTAMVQASIRFMGTFEPESFRTNDSFAIHFLDNVFSLSQYQVGRTAALAVMEKQWPGTYAHIRCLSKLGDEAFQSFAGHQIVSLFPGYCTRSQRFADHIMTADIMLFEIDFADVQAKKRRVMQISCPMGAALTRSLVVEATTTEPWKTLANSEYDESLETLFMWEQASMYETESTVKAFFLWVQQNAPKGSMLFFDYMLKEKHGNNEPKNSLFRMDESLQTWLESQHFKLEKQWTHSELAAMSNSPVNPMYGICLARLVRE